MTVEQSKCLQANAFVQASLFQEFTFNSPGPVAFQVSLSTLIVSFRLRPMIVLIIDAAMQGFSRSL